LENERLKELLQMRREDSQPVAYAQVIGRSGREDFHVLVVNAGSSKGVAKGMAVATPDGLVGFVTAVAPFAAKVMMLTDATARVDVVLQRTRHRAILFGRGRPLCTLEYLDPGTDAAEGDRVVASGADGLAPKGVAVGVVQQVQRGDFGVVQSIVIEPAVDFSTVEDVAILPIQPGAVELLP
jgi:rod shape-determining protein MreC